MAGNPGTEIDSRVKILSGHIFPKTMPSAFSNPKLEKFLDEHEIAELCLTGLDAEFCVHATAKAALKRGYRVTMIKDAIAARNAEKWDGLLASFEREGIKLIASSLL